MTVEVNCPSCDTLYRIAIQNLGETARCKQCGESFTTEVGVDRTATFIPNQDTNASKPTDTGSGAIPAALGRFIVRGKLGAGAFGAVYRAYDPLLEREVALKIPHAGTLASESDKTRYLREPKAAAQLRHPNIVPIHDAVLEGDNIFLASAFIEGQTLKDVLVEKQLDFRRTASIIIKLAGALDYAHRQGIIHRDVKPANIMLDTKDEPMLMDFGLARIQESAEELTHDGMVLGTPAYMSPEQARGQQDRIGPASDQYSLGVVLYELFCGKRPFTGTPSVVISLVQNQEPTSPTQHNKNIPKDLETICLKAMAKEPQQRYASCQDLADDLRRWLDDEPVHARRLSFTERASRWCRRNPAIAGLTVAVFLVFLIGFSLTTWQWMVARKESKKANRQTKLAIENATIANANEVKARRAQQKEKEYAETLRQNLYVADMNRVQNFLDDGSDDLASKLLNSYLPQPGKTDLRGFEWYYLRRICRSSFFNFMITEMANSVAFSPDGKWVATVDHKKSIAILEISTEKYRQKLNGHTDTIFQVTFSPDGRFVASASKDKTICLWDTKSWKLVRTLKGHDDAVESIAFSSDGKQLASAGADAVIIWEVETGESLHSLTGAKNRAVIAPPDTTIFKSHLFLTANVFEQREPRDSPAEIRSSVAFGSDDKHIITADGAVVVVRDILTGNVLHSLRGHKGSVLCVAASPDGQWIASGGIDKTVRLWDAKTGKRWEAKTGKRRYSLNAHDSYIADIAFSPDSQRLASTASDQAMKLWDVAAGLELFNFKWAFNGLGSVAFSSDGRRIAATSGSGVRVWRVPQEAGMIPIKKPIFHVKKGGRDPRRYKNNLGGMAFSPDGKHFISSVNDETFTMRDVNTKKVVRTFTGHDGIVTCVTFSHNGKQIASTSFDGTAKLWDAATGKVIVTFEGHTAETTHVTFNSDSQRIATASRDKTVKVWDAVTGKELLTFSGHFNFVSSVAFSPDGKQIASASHVTIRVWDANSGVELRNMVGGVSIHNCVVYSSDGKQLAVANRFDVDLWDTASGKLSKRLSGHTGYVKSIAFTADGRRLVTAGMDKTIKLWKPSTGDLLLTLPGHAHTVERVAFSPDGRWIASADILINETIHLWNGRPLEEEKAAVK